MDANERTNKDHAVEADWQSFTLTNGAGGHTGFLEIRWKREGDWLTVRTERYRITGNGSRNKANINFSVLVTTTYQQFSWRSPDDRRQDNIWHDWKNERDGLLKSGAHLVKFTTEFVFDTSGTDPRVEARHTAAI